MEDPSSYRARPRRGPGSPPHPTAIARGQRHTRPDADRHLVATSEFPISGQASVVWTRLRGCWARCRRQLSPLSDGASGDEHGNQDQRSRHRRPIYSGGFRTTPGPPFRRDWRGCRDAAIAPLPRPSDTSSGDRDDSRDVFFIVLGRCELPSSRSAAARCRSATSRPEMFGELAAIDGLPRSCTVVALSDTMLAVLLALRRRRDDG